MISAPSSSSASLRRPFTAACVPTGRKNGVSMEPWGVVKRPRRAPLGSVFDTAKEKLIFDQRQEKRTAKNACPTSVYQEKMNAQPTRHTTYAAQTLKAMVKALAPFSFLGFTAANPMARRTSVQNVNKSIDLPSATSHFADSSGSSAARFAATGFSRSAVPYGFR